MTTLGAPLPGTRVEHDDRSTRAKSLVLHSHYTTMHQPSVTICIMSRLHVRG